METIISEISTAKFWTITVLFGVILGVFTNLLTDVLRKHGLKKWKPHIETIVLAIIGIILGKIYSPLNLQNGSDMIAAILIITLVALIIKSYTGAYRPLNLRGILKIIGIVLAAQIIPLSLAFYAIYISYPFTVDISENLGSLSRVIVRSFVNGAIWLGVYHVTSKLLDKLVDIVASKTINQEDVIPEE